MKYYTKTKGIDYDMYSPRVRVPKVGFVALGLLLVFALFSGEIGNWIISIFS